MKYKIKTVDGEEHIHAINGKTEEMMFYQLSDERANQMLTIIDEFGYVTIYNVKNIISIASLEPGG